MVGQDARGTAFALGAVLGLLVGVGIASYSAVPIARLPLLAAVVTLRLVALLGLVGKYHLSLNPLSISALLLLAGLFPAVVRVGEYAVGSAVALVGTMILVPLGISAAAYLVNQFDSYGDVWMAAVAIASLSGAAFLQGKTSAVLILLAGFGAIVPLLADAGRWQAKELVGDIGTFAIGALMAVAAVSSGLEFPAVSIFIPYLLNLGLRARGRSLAQIVTKASGSQRRSALILTGVEAVLGLIAVLICVQG
jgi:UDP-N-acetylmuramyl pentapeptide phosphotransferase/UDP-N-acetylglucosamine-1-phosphate transferase